MSSTAICNIAPYLQHVAELISLPEIYLKIRQWMTDTTSSITDEVSHTAMFVKTPKTCSSALEGYHLKNASIDKFERIRAGFDYCQPEVEMMRFWKLPELYQEVARHHLHPQYAEKNYRAAIEVIHLSHAICLSPKIGQHNELIINSKNTNPIFKNLPNNIDKIIVGNSATHEDPILSILWTNHVLENYLSGENNNKSLVSNE
jgi:hypothetical protein